MKFIQRINSYKADPMGWVGSVVMLGFAGYALWRWHLSGFIFFALLFLRDIVAAWFLLTRASSKNGRSGYFLEILAYVSSGWSFLYLPSEGGSAVAFLTASFLSIAGFALSTFALFDLGRSFGISPANRGVIRSGVYRYLKHPMYIGYGVSEAGFIILNPWNALIWILSGAMYVLRAKVESKFIKDSIY